MGGSNSFFPETMLRRGVSGRVFLTSIAVPPKTGQGERTPCCDVHLTVWFVSKPKPTVSRFPVDTSGNRSSVLYPKLRKAKVHPSGRQ